MNHPNRSPGPENGLLWAGSSTTPDKYHLTKVLPAIDHGVNSGISSGIDGNPRPWGAGFDLGAAEYPQYRAYLPMVQRQ